MFNSNVKEILTITFCSCLLAVTACSKLCNAGYEGKRCNVLETTKFTGKWNALDTPGNLNYIDTITQGQVIEDITLSPSFGLHRFNHAINASVISTTITIPYQQPDSGGNFLSGTGLLNSSGNQISFTYQILLGTDTSQIVGAYTGTWTKQN